MEPYVSSRSLAATVTAAIQGLILTALALDTAEDALHEAIADLVRRFRDGQNDMPTQPPR